MKEKKHDIFDETVKSKFDNYSLPVDEELWSDLEQRLSEKDKTIFRKSWFYGAVGVAACAVFALLFLFHDNTMSPEKSLISENKSESIDILEEPVSEEKMVEEKTSVSEEKIKKRFVKTTPKEPIIADFIEENETKIDKKDSVLYADNEIEIIPEATNELPAESGKIQKRQILEEDNLDFIEEISISSKKTTNSYLLAASFGTASSPGINGSNGYYFNDYAPNYASSSDKESLSSDNSDSDYDEITHSPAISFGLTVRKEITPVFSLESGLMYTYLHSKLENARPLKQAESHLHYLGIPVNGIFKVYSKPKWNIYVSAGGMIEKGIRSKFKETIYNEKGNNNTLFNSSIDGFQWSLNGGVGFDYRIHKNWSIYFEPRLLYYFDNNQPVSIRSEDPFSFGIKGGLRLNFNN